ncbi:MAG: monovalent cation/H+ antiporter complex subunit F [Desulfurococcaceae archaeon]
MIWEIILAISIIYTIAIALLTVIALKGPTLGDQVLAIDTITYATVVLMVLFSVFFKEPILTVVAIPLALWIYALDIYVAKYLEKGDLGA